MKKKIAILIMLVVVFLPLLVFAQDPGVPQVPAGYETVYLMLSTLGGILIVPLIQFLKKLAWYPKENSSWLDWIFQFVFSFIIGAVLSLLYIKKLELNQIFVVTFIMVISAFARVVQKTATK